QLILSSWKIRAFGIGASLAFGPWALGPFLPVATSLSPEMSTFSSQPIDLTLFNPSSPHESQVYKRPKSLCPHPHRAYYLRARYE
ncbi:MAG: hypothetical protein ACXW3Z_14905, partial [Limisphaerales bacterium]